MVINHALSDGRARERNASDGTAPAVVDGAPRDRNLLSTLNNAHKLAMMSADNRAHVGAHEVERARRKHHVVIRGSHNNCLEVRACGFQLNHRRNEHATTVLTTAKLAVCALNGGDLAVERIPRRRLVQVRREVRGVVVAVPVVERQIDTTTPRAYVVAESLGGSDPVFAITQDHITAVLIGFAGARRVQHATARGVSDGIAGALLPILVKPTEHVVRDLRRVEKRVPEKLRDGKTFRVVNAQRREEFTVLAHLKVPHTELVELAVDGVRQPIVRLGCRSKSNFRPIHTTNVRRVRLPHVVDVHHVRAHADSRLAPLNFLVAFREPQRAVEPFLLRFRTSQRGSAHRVDDTNASLNQTVHVSNRASHFEPKVQTKSKRSPKRSPNEVKGNEREQRKGVTFLTFKNQIRV